jgi:hypothetical protein
MHKLVVEVQTFDDVCSQVLLLAVPGREGATAVDPDGHMALAVLRTLGLPEVAVAVQCPGR